jgi:predicted metal-dependent hydrolase
MNPTKNLIELKLYRNPTKNLIELKLYMNPTKNQWGSCNVLSSIRFLVGIM